MSKLAISTNVEITQNDVVTVAVSRAETMMQNNLNIATKRVAELEKKIKANEKEIAKLTETAGTATVKDAVAKLTEAMAFLNPAQKITVEGVVACPYGRDKKAEESYVRVKIGTTGGQHYDLSVDHKFATPPEALKLLTDNVNLAKTLDETRVEAVSWRRRLASISTLERKYRAQLVEGHLKQTDEGQALLDTIASKFENDILALPG